MAQHEGRNAARKAQPAQALMNEGLHQQPLCRAPRAEPFGERPAAVERERTRFEQSVPHTEHCREKHSARGGQRNTASIVLTQIIFPQLPFSLQIKRPPADLLPVANCTQGNFAKQLKKRINFAPHQLRSSW